jgi:hypothetical protein
MVFDSCFGSLDQLVDQFRSQHVLDPMPLLGGLGTERDQQMALAGAGVPDWTQ